MTLAGSPATSPDLAAPLDEEQAVRLALARHPTVEAGRQRALAATDFAQTAAVLSAPVLKVATSDTMADPTNSNRKNTIGVEWSPPQPGEAGLRRTANERRRDEAVLVQAIAREKLAADVRNAHASLRVLDALLDEATGAQAARQRLRDLVRDALVSRKRTQADAIAADLQLAEGLSSLESLRQERSQVSIRLRALLLETGSGRPLEVPREMLDSARPHPMPAPESSLALALSDRPELRAVSARCAGIAADVALQQLDNRPWISDVQLTYANQQGGKPSSWGLQLAFKLPVTGPRSGSAATADATRSACDAELAALEHSVRQEVLEAYRRLDASQRSWLHIQQTLLPLHEQSVQTGDRAMKAGRLEQSEWVALELRRLDARQAALRRLLELRQAEISLAQAIGRLGPATAGTQVN